VTRGAAAAPHPTDRRTGLAATLAAAALVVAGCATVSGPRSGEGGETLSGRLAVRVEASGQDSARSLSAAFDLRGTPAAGTLGLSTPLGSLLAQARWSPAEVVLATPQGTRRFDSLEALTREVLGESVPIEAWFDWLRGRPWPGAPSEPALATGGPPPGTAGAGPAAAQAPPPSAAGFAQLGWAVDLTRFGEGAVSATRAAPAPAVTVRIRLDRS
jgi:outer membrane lipoprotein LolB